MRYRVAFTKREESTMRPSAELDLNLSDGVVAEKVLMEELDSEAQHGEEELDEDDSFLGSAAAGAADAAATRLGQGGVYPGRVEPEDTDDDDLQIKKGRDPSLGLT